MGERPAEEFARGQADRWRRRVDPAAQQRDGILGDDLEIAGKHAACPLPEAKKMYDRLALLDPTAAKQAESFLSLPGGLGAPAPAEKPQSSDNSGATKQSSAPAGTSKTAVVNTSKSGGKGK